MGVIVGCFFFSSRRRHTRYWRDWSSDVCSSDLEVFGDDRGARHRRMALLDQHRRLAFGIERQEFLAPFPHALLDEPWWDAELAQREPHEARMRTERVMKQCDHGPSRFASCSVAVQ